VSLVLFALKIATFSVKDSAKTLFLKKYVCRLPDTTKIVIKNRKTVFRAVRAARLKRVLGATAGLGVSAGSGRYDPISSWCGSSSRAAEASARAPLKTGF